MDLRQLKLNQHKFQHSDSIITIEAHPRLLLYVLIHSCRVLFTVELGSPHSRSAGQIQSSVQRGLPCAREQILNC